MIRWKFFTPVMIPMLFGMVLLSGCVTTESKWTHTEIPADEWGVDGAQCKWEARRKAQREAEENRAHTADDTFDDAQSIDSLFASADITKRSRVLFSRCMQSLGYVAVE